MSVRPLALRSCPVQALMTEAWVVAPDGVGLIRQPKSQRQKDVDQVCNRADLFLQMR